MKTTILTSVLALTSVFAPALAQDYPVTVTDHRGVDVSLAVKPERVAALSIFAADVLSALGLAPAGMVTYEGRFPPYLDLPMGLTDYGDMTAPNLELMAQDGIDLAIGMMDYATPFADDIEKQSAFIATNDLTLEDSYSAVEILAAALGEPEHGFALNAEFERAVERYAEAAPGGVKGLFVWSYYDTLYAYYDNLLPAGFLPLLGADNALGAFEGATAHQAFKPIEAEELLVLDPDVLFMYVSHGDSAKFNPVFERLRAHREGRAYSVGDHYSQPVGPIAREMVLKEVAYLLYPDTFSAPELPDGSSARPMVFE